MTLQEMVDQLEGLKDYVNDHGKGVLARVQSELKLLEIKVTQEELVVVAVPVDVPQVSEGVKAPETKEKPKVLPKVFKPANVVSKAKPKKKK